MQVGRVLFLDLMRFTFQSLENLVNTLNDEDFLETKKEFGRKSAKLFSHCCHPDNVECCELCKQYEEISQLADLVGTEHYMHHCQEFDDEGGCCNHYQSNKRVTRFELICSKGVFCYDAFTDMDFPGQTKFIQ